MSKEVSFKNRDRFVQLGIAIAALRKMRGLSQEKLAERAGVSRSLISTIEAPNMAHGFSLDVFLPMRWRSILPILSMPLYSRIGS
jgi:DNA-binding XRE family transcriptional regulator